MPQAGAFHTSWLAHVYVHVHISASKGLPHKIQSKAKFEAIAAPCLSQANDTDIVRTRQYSCLSLLTQLWCPQDDLQDAFVMKRGELSGL